MLPFTLQKPNAATPSQPIMKRTETPADIACIATKYGTGQTLWITVAV
jgi:hypothetical protein